MDSGTALETSADAPADGITADAGADAPDAGSYETGAAAPCDGGGYFIVVGDEAGSQVLRDSCDRFMVPNLSWGLCREDCQCSHVVGCSDASALDLAFADMLGNCATVREVGLYAIDNASWTSGGTTTGFGGGWIRLATFPPYPGPVTGDYSVTLLPVDGGQAHAFGGTFCIQQ
jgi:hypothetical protein